MGKFQPKSYDFPPGVPDIPQEIADHKENVRELALLITGMDPNPNKKRKDPERGLHAFMRAIGVWYS